MVGIAAIDLIIGLLILFAPGFTSTMLKLPLPSEMFYVWLVGMLQLNVGLAYLIGGISPVHHFGNIVLAAVMRLPMAVLLIVIGTTQGFEHLYLRGSGGNPDRALARSLRCTSCT
jgi:hypothetical protein